MIYTSRASIPFDDASLVAMLYKSRSDNDHTGIISVLSFGYGLFRPILGGSERQEVAEVMRKISAGQGVVLLEKTAAVEWV